MSSTGKRLDLRFGAFACSVQGFDDPVQPVQQILRAIQHLLEESPELSDTGINFDAEAIEQLVGEVARRAELAENEVEIVPGLIIIHHGSGSDLAAEPADEAATGNHEEAWRAESREEVDTERGEAGYVNIFAPGGDGTSGTDEPYEEDAAYEAETADEGDEEEHLVARLRRVAEGGDADDAWDETGGAEAGHGAAQEEPWQEDARHGATGEPEEAASRPVNLFAAGETASDEAEADAATRARSLFSVIENEPEEAPAETAEDAEEGYTAAGLAERAGMRAVPDLMVAAAAWMVLIRGQTQFTRRDVLDIFDTIPGEHEKTPEARIKGFGKAVRNGRLVMIEEGVFGISRAELDRFQELL